jgi:hypothetical protein
MDVNNILLGGALRRRVDPEKSSECVDHLHNNSRDVSAGGIDNKAAKRKKVYTNSRVGVSVFM